MRNFYLGDHQNAVQNVGIDGRVIDSEEDPKEKEKNISNAEKA